MQPGLGNPDREGPTAQMGRDLRAREGAAADIMKRQGDRVGWAHR